MHAGVLQRRATIATRRKRLHEPKRDARIVRITRRACLPQFRCLGKLLRRLGVFSEGLERLVVAGCEAAALTVRPLFEILRLAQKESVEKWTAVERDCARVIPALNSCRKL